MAAWHLAELKAALEKRGWRMSAEVPGNGRDISGTWEMHRSGDVRTLLLDFEGLDEKDVLPLNESYACRVRGMEASLYFGRRGERGSDTRARWSDQLEQFVERVS